MAIQLIICVEADKKSRSDYIYIKSVIDKCYVVDSSVKLSPVYMGGKTKYKNITKEITEQTKAYNGVGESIVLMCFDTDDYDIKQEDKNFVEKAKQYCKENEYEYVWFCKDIERVFLNKKVSDSEKVKEAKKYLSGKVINRFDINKLKHWKSQCKNVGLGQYINVGFPT